MFLFSEAAVLSDIHCHLVPYVDDGAADMEDALELIKEMCLLGHADDDLSDEEVLFIGEVGQAMGIELEKIEQISNWVIDYLIWNDQGKIIFEKI